MLIYLIQNTHFSPRCLMRKALKWLAHSLAARNVSFVTLLLCGLLSGCGKVASLEAVGQPGPHVSEVGVVKLQASDQIITTELPGRTTAYLSADIRPQVGGIVKARLFEEGSQVKAGQVLYQIEQATYGAAVRSAQAAVVKARATLASAKVTAERNAEMVKIDAISKQTNENSQAALQEAEADLGSAEAALQTARINLGFTKITAPISGRVDTSTVTPGALVEANQATALTTVQQSDPIYVDIPQSSTALLKLKREMTSGALSKDGQTTIRLLLDDGSTYAHEGTLRVSGAQVNQASGAVTLRALVPNPEGLLMPGMYVRAMLAEGVAQKALLVPQQSLTRTPSGDATVLVVGAGGKVEKRSVTVGRAISHSWQVTAGLATGEEVIVEGSQKISVGDTVKAVPSALAQAQSQSVASLSNAVTAPKE